MKNTEIAFDSFKQYLLIDIYVYLSLHIAVNGDSLEVFRLFTMFLKDKAFK